MMAEENRDTVAGVDPDRSLSTPSGTSRRGVFRGGALVGAAAAAGLIAAAVPARAATASAKNSGGGGHSDDGPGLALINGRIHTMDPHRTVASAVLVRNGRIAEIGKRVSTTDATVVDLHGRTVVPGIIDSHNHIVLVGNRPGYHTPLEDITSLQGLLDRYRVRRRDVPPGQFITTIGPVSTMQLAPGRRLPTLQELDAAVPDRPIYLHPAIHPASGSATNTLGKQFFESLPLPATVGDDGSIAANANGQGRALLGLRQAFLTPESRQRTARETLQYYAGFGITTHLDQGAFQAVNDPTDGVASEDNFRMYDPYLAVFAAGTASARLRFNYLYMDQDPLSQNLSLRLKNAFQFYGDDLIRSGSAGEFVAPDPTDPMLLVTAGFPPVANTDNNTRWLYAAMKVAQAGWRAEVHSLSATDFKAEIDGFLLVNDQFPITDKRWVVAHVPSITPDYVAKLKTIGGGLKVWGGPIHTPDAPREPPWRSILDSGIHVGYHSDGGDFEMINPWLNFYTLVTGKNLQGDQLNPGQTLSRDQALWLATAANKWFIGEDDLGSIELGNHGDLAVLDRDYFSVPVDDIKKIRSAMTVLGGRLVHDTVGRH